MKYTFIMEETDIRGELVGNKLVSEFNADYLQDILVKFQDFLKGSGFVFEGQLDVVNDFEEPPEWHNEEFETPQEPVHDWSTPKFDPAQELYDEMDYGVSKPKNTAPWDWTVNELMKGPITTKDVEVKIPSDYSINYGAGQPIVTVNGGIDTITLTDFNVGSGGISCEICGLPKNVMKSHNCYDVNCPKGTWK